MGSTLDDHIQVAVGHDNEAGLEGLHELDPPALAPYRARGGILTMWADSEESERNANREIIPIGPPHVELLLHNLTPDERALLVSLEGDVTIRLFNKTTAAWGNYNGIWEVPIDQSRWADAQDMWLEVRVNVWELEAI